MRVTVNGKIVAVLEKREGVSKAGQPWATQDYVIQPDGDEDIICFNVFGEDKIADYKLHVGSIVSVTLVISSREYNGKYYPSIKAIQCYEQSKSSTAAQPVSQDKSTVESVSSLPF